MVVLMKIKVKNREIDIPSDLDTTLNLKVNSVLKQEFEQLCKDDHSNVSRELKVFMLNCVKSQSLDHKKWYFI